MLKAHRLLGRCYYEAKGVLHDLRRAGEHLEVARRGGLADAATDLGALYEEHGQVAEAMARVPAETAVAAGSRPQSHTAL